MFHEILEKIQAYDRVIIHRHSKPDGDAIGSQVGLKHILKTSFPNKEVYAVGDPAGRYSFIADSQMDEVADELYTDALAIILDTGSPALVSDNRYTLAAATARMDHHLFCEKFADAEVIDSTFESCCGLVAAFAKDCGLQLNGIAASALFTGMVTDSGRFRYDSTNSRTFQLASFLMEQSVDTNEIYKKLYADNLQMRQLRARFTLKIQLTKNNVAYIYTTKDELSQLDVDTFTVSRGMVNTMSDIAGVGIWVNFTETENGVLCELRSNSQNINPIAVKYGGGGHQKASGATVADFDTAMQMLADLDALQGDCHE